MFDLKKTVLTPLAVLFAATSLQAVAADPISHTIQLEAFVPTDEFHVLPVDPSWIGVPQSLNYDVATGNLSSLNELFSVKHSAGPIHASLTSAALLTNGPDQIDLSVKFNNVVLTTTPVEVVTQAAAATVSRVPLAIAAIKPGGNYKPGNYTGNVNLQFDAIVGTP
jgi:hypothetical protein